MDGESGADVESKGDEPQDGAFVEAFAVSPDGGERRYDESESSVEAGFLVDDQARGEPDVRSDERGEAENEERGDHEVFAGHGASLARR